MDQTLGRDAVLDCDDNSMPMELGLHAGHHWTKEMVSTIVGHSFLPLEHGVVKDQVSNEMHKKHHEKPKHIIQLDVTDEFSPVDSSP